MGNSKDVISSQKSTELPSSTKLLFHGDIEDYLRKSSIYIINLAITKSHKFQIN